MDNYLHNPVNIFVHNLRMDSVSVHGSACSEGHTERL
jgi:hypothetical protein